MRKRGIALVASLLLAGATSARAASITIPEVGGCSPFGEPNSAYVGQTFQALPGLADQLKFTLNDTGTEPDATKFHVLLAEWDGYDPGTVLFESDDLSVADGSGRTDFTISLGGIDLVDGNSYVVVLDAFVLFDGVEGTTALACDNSASYPGGTFVAYNAYGGDRTSHFGEGGWNTFDTTELTMQLTFTECGNSVVEIGEDCEDGNTTDGDCCSSTCQYESVGSPCDDANACTVADGCSAGSCIPGVAADCDDGDLCTVDTCDEVDGCHNDGVPVPAEDCHQPGKAMFLVVDAAAKKMKWMWKKGDVVAPADLGAPAVDTDYALCVFDRSGGTPDLVASYRVPAGATAWSIKPSTVKYVEKTGSPEGITLAWAKAVDLPGKSAALMKAGGGSLVLPTAYSASEFFDLDTSITVQALNGVGTCWSTDFATATKNTATKFKAVAP